MKSEDEKLRKNFTDEVDSEFTWCLHCERVHKTAAWVKKGWNCPEEGCDGGILDAHSWGADNWPKNVNSHYPDVPVIGEISPVRR